MKKYEYVKVHISKWIWTIYKYLVLLAMSRADMAQRECSFCG